MVPLVVGHGKNARVPFLSARYPGSVDAPAPRYPLGYPRGNFALGYDVIADVIIHCL